MALHDAICARAVIPRLQPDARVYFFIDNTIAIKTGMGYVKCRSHPGIAKVIVENIRLISQSHQVMLIWTPGHANITGNEIADFLAKRGAEGITNNDTPPVDILRK